VPSDDESNYAAAQRYSGAYRAVHAVVEKLRNETSEDRLRRVQAENEARALLDLGQVHAMLAIADEIRATRERLRIPGSPRLVPPWMPR
jgi:hypothetical protein